MFGAGTGAVALFASYLIASDIEAWYTLAIMSLSGRKLIHDISLVLAYEL
jgi:hypothetical protein